MEIRIMTITNTDALKLYRDVRIGVMAGMETGNFDHARNLLTEYRAVDPERAAVITTDVVDSYHISI